MEYNDFISEEIIKNQHIARNELTAKGKLSKGYYKSLENLTGVLGSGSRKSIKERKEYVKNVFDKQASIKRRDPYIQGEINAIMTLKKHNSKKGLNIYGEKIRKGR